MTSNITICSAIVLLVIIVLIVLIICPFVKRDSNKTNDQNQNNQNNQSEEITDTSTNNKEGFLLTSQNAYISPVTGAIKGPGIMTDGMTRSNMSNIVDSVAKTGFGSDDSISIGVGPGNGFDQAYENQLDIQKIDDRNVGGYQSIDDLDQISRKIASGSNNANNNMYTRAGSKPVKLVIEPNSIRGVIDEKYLPDRDKNYQIATVQAAVPVQGYDINVERIPEYLSNTHFSKVSRNGTTKRIPTAAGAVGGGYRMGDNAITDNHMASSANKNAVDQLISIKGNDIVIKDNVTGNTILAPMDNVSSETYKQTYVKGDHM